MSVSEWLAQQQLLRGKTLGPQGPTGPIGRLGASTVVGPTGATGSQGRVGPSGPRSAAKGPSGPTGPTGPTGPRGATGAALGDTGPTGSSGPIGSSRDGITGATGTVGAVGQSGPSGLEGLFPLVGVSGFPGLVGAGGIGTYKILAAGLAITNRTDSRVLYTFQNIISNNINVQGIYRLVANRPALRDDDRLDDRKFIIVDFMITSVANIRGNPTVRLIQTRNQTSNNTNFYRNTRTIGSDYGLEIGITPVSAFATDDYYWSILVIQSPLNVPTLTF